MTRSRDARADSKQAERVRTEIPTPAKKESTVYADWSLDRLWQHGLHEDDLFGSHLQYFMTFESILFLAIATLDGRSHFGHVLPWFAAAGIALAAVWLFILWRQAHYVDFIAKRLHGNISGKRAIALEYYETYFHAMGDEEPGIAPLVSTKSKLGIAVIVPGVVIGLWVAILLIIA